MEADQSDFEIAGVAAFFTAVAAASATAGCRRLPALASLPLLSKPIKQ